MNTGAVGMDDGRFAASGTNRMFSVYDTVIRTFGSAPSAESTSFKAFIPTVPIHRDRRTHNRAHREAFITATSFHPGSFHSSDRRGNQFIPTEGEGSGKQSRDLPNNRAPLRGVPVLFSRSLCVPV